MERRSASASTCVSSPLSRLVIFSCGIESVAHAGCPRVTVWTRRRVSSDAVSCGKRWASAAGVKLARFCICGYSGRSGSGREDV